MGATPTRAAICLRLPQAKWPLSQPPPGLSWRECLIQRRHAMGVQVVQHQAYHRDIEVPLMHQPPRPVGKVHFGAPLRNRHLLPPELVEEPLDVEHRALGHVQSLGHPGAGQPSPILSRMRARLTTLAEPFPARIMRFSWLRSSGVSRTANFSPTTPTASQQHRLPAGQHRHPAPGYNFKTKLD